MRKPYTLLHIINIVSHKIRIRVLINITIVHKTARNIGICDNRCHFRIVFKSPYIIDQVGAACKSRLRDLTFICIKGDNNVRFFLNLFNNRTDSFDFLLVRDHRISRSCRFTADIYDIRTVINHFERMLKRCFFIIITSSV